MGPSDLGEGHMPKGSNRSFTRAPARLAAVSVALAALAASACMQRPRPPGPTTTTARPGGSGTTAPRPTTTTSVPAAPSGTFDSTRVHALSITYDPAAYDAMIATFRATGDKEWISATVTIDGTTYENVGIRLKGNSSLGGVRRPGSRPGGPSGGATAETPEKLPWLVKFNEFVKGQKHEGRKAIVVRSNPTQTSLNEAVSLELLARTGLAYQRSAHYALTVNGERRALRLVTENPDDDWEEEHFDSAGILYKAEAGGNYSYRGHDPEAYDEIFEQESGDDNLVPLMDFLQFINQASDATFAEELPERLDVEAFADYLAFEDLIGNWDDIEGPGNNSYLRWNEDTNSFTIVAWDHNLALGGMGGAPFPGGRQILVRRYKAVPAFNELYNAAMTRLRADLFASGAAREILDRRAAVLRREATNLVPVATIDAEVARVATYFRPN
jgi:spore coat protein CotH